MTSSTRHVVHHCPQQPECLRWARWHHAFCGGAQLPPCVALRAHPRGATLVVVLWAGPVSLLVIRIWQRPGARVILFHARTWDGGRKAQHFRDLLTGVSLAAVRSVANGLVGDFAQAVRGPNTTTPPISFLLLCHRAWPHSAATVCLGLTNGLTLFQPFNPRNVPKRVFGLSSSIKNVILYTATYEKFCFFEIF